MKNLMKKLQHLLFSKWFFILYFALGLIYFFAFSFCVQGITWEKSFFITLGLMTGSDPFSFNSPAIEPNKGLWWLAWVIHLGSWLLIPALIGIKVNEATENIKREQRWKVSLSQLLEELGLESERIPSATVTVEEEMKKMINESKK